MPHYDPNAPKQAGMEQITLDTIPFVLGMYQIKKNLTGLVSFWGHDQS